LKYMANRHPLSLFCGKGPFPSRHRHEAVG
jgi:hypothetical protein